MIDFLKRYFYKRRVKKVADYYNQWSDKFKDITDTFQGFRTADINQFHDYTVKAAELKAGDVLVDAGCGVGGPAFYFAKNAADKVFALTNSQAQVDIINARKKSEAVENLQAVLGDYHHITDSVPAGTATRVFFLESLGHSYYPELALTEAWKVLQSGGKIYIRDLFAREDGSPQERAEIEKLIAEANNTFVYNHAPASLIVQLLQKIGFQVEYTRMPDVVFQSIDHEFEKRYGIKTPKGIPFVIPLEILALKP